MGNLGFNAENMNRLASTYDLEVADTLIEKAATNHEYDIILNESLFDNDAHVDAVRDRLLQRNFEVTYRDDGGLFVSWANA